MGSIKLCPLLTQGDIDPAQLSDHADAQPHTNVVWVLARST